jgi:hypothetical protein
MSVMARCFPAPITPWDYCNNADFYTECIQRYHSIVPDELAHRIQRYRGSTAGDVNYMFYTKPGPGPVSLTDERLLDENGSNLPPGPKHRKLVIPSSKDASKTHVHDSPLHSTRATTSQIPPQCSSTNKSSGNTCCAIPPSCILWGAIAVAVGFAIGTYKRR